MNEQSYDIYKAAGLIIIERKVLATRSKGKTTFVQPGGKLEPGETEAQAVVRELREELGIEVAEKDLIKVGDYFAEAAGQPGASLKLAAFLVGAYKGEPAPHSEIEEIVAVNSRTMHTVELGSIFEHDIIPELVKRNLID